MHESMQEAPTGLFALPPSNRRERIGFKESYSPFISAAIHHSPSSLGTAEKLEGLLDFTRVTPMENRRRKGISFLLTISTGLGLDIL
jgi:hypothetical protein